MKQWTNVRRIVPQSFALLTIASLAIVTSAAESHLRININSIWQFHYDDTITQPYTNDHDHESWDFVSIPSSLEIFTANLADFRTGGRKIGWYCRKLTVPKAWIGKRVFLEFQ